MIDPNAAGGSQFLAANLSLVVEKLIALSGFDGWRAASLLMIFSLVRVLRKSLSPTGVAIVVVMLSCRPSSESAFSSENFARAVEFATLLSGLLLCGQIATGILDAIIELLPDEWSRGGGAEDPNAMILGIELFLINLWFTSGGHLGIWMPGSGGRTVNPFATDGLNPVEVLVWILQLMCHLFLWKLTLEFALALWSKRRGLGDFSNEWVLLRKVVGLIVLLPCSAWLGSVDLLRMLIRQSETHLP